MGFIREMLFESPIVLYMTLALAAMVSLAIWHKTRASQPLWILAACAALAGVVALADLLVETDREQIEQTFTEIRLAAAENDVDAIMSLVSDGFSAQGVNKAGFRRVLLMVRQYVDFRSVDLDSLLVESIEQDRAKAVLTAIYWPNKYYAQWRLTFARESDGRWRIQSVSAADHAGMDLRDVLPLAPKDKRSPAKSPLTPPKSATP